MRDFARTLLLSATVGLLLTACQPATQEQKAEQASAQINTEAPQMQAVANRAAAEADADGATEKADGKAGAPAALAAFSFTEREYDFGQADEGDVVEHTFSFTNTGAAPLVIRDIKTTCGCTTPSYTREPILPGEKGKIDVRFNTQGKRGRQNKVVTIYANVEGSISKIAIKGNVNYEKLPDGPFRQ